MDSGTRYISNISDHYHLPKLNLNSPGFIVELNRISQKFTRNEDAANADLKDAEKKDTRFQDDFESKLRNFGRESLKYKTLANILNIKPGKILSYNNANANIDMIAELSMAQILDHREKTSQPPKYQPKVAYRVLDAPELRNDYYSNLVSWSSASGEIVVGLGKAAYFWNEKTGVKPVNIYTQEFITCVSFSNKDNLLIGTQKGKLNIISQRLNRVIGRYKLENGACARISIWTKKGNLYVGDSLGTVSYFEIKPSKKIQADVRLISQLKFHKQQICGLAINIQETQLAIGGNDNICSVWDIENKNRHTIKFVLHHDAAVKALAFCPWCDSLLATGGGTKDRQIKFWHTGTGILLNKYNTNCQVTSIFWCKYKKELVATFGFNDGPNRVVLAGYAYPTMDIKFVVKGTENLRFLSAVESPNGENICVVTNDETVRFYNIWETAKYPLKICTDFQLSPGIYGSTIIESIECGVQLKERIR